MKKDFYLIACEATERVKAVNGEDFTLTFNWPAYEPGDYIAPDPDRPPHLLIKSIRDSDAHSESYDIELSWDEKSLDLVRMAEGAYDHFFHCGIRYFKVVDKGVPEKKLFAMKAVLYGMGDFAVMAFPGKKYDKGWVIKPYFVSDTPLPQYVVTHVSEYFPGSAIYFLKRVDREPSYRSLSELNTLEGAVFHGIYTAHLEYDGSPSMPDLDIWV